MFAFARKIRQPSHLESVFWFLCRLWVDNDLRVMEDKLLVTAHSVFREMVLLGEAAPA